MAQAHPALVWAAFLLWVFTTSMAALYVKEWVQLFPLPLMATTAQAFVGTILTGLYLYSTNELKFASFSDFSGLDLFNVFGGHMLGTTLTNMANLQSSASFVNTLKACDPLFALVGAKVILNQQFSRTTHISLVMIVFGIILACTTEFQFQFSGFALAMVSTALFVARAVSVKKVISETSLNGQNLFFQVSIFTCVVSAIFSVFEYLMSNTDTDDPQFYPLLFKAALAHWSYNILSFWLVTQLSVMTYSVGNSVKRLLTIYSSILYFRNPVSLLNGIASLIAVAGVFLYSYEDAKMKISQKEKKEEPTESPSDLV